MDEKQKDSPKQRFRLTKKQIIFSVLLLSFLCTFILIIIALAYTVSRNNTNNSGSNSEDIETPEGERPTPTTTPTPTIPSVSDPKVAYIYENNLWIVNGDGTGRTQITTDGNGDTVSYPAFDWKNPESLSYAKCDASGCKIINYQLTTTATVEVLTLPPFTQGVEAIEWSHNEAFLGYIFVKGDYSREAIIRNSSGTLTTLGTYPAPLGRGGTYADGIEVIFSPDNNKVIIFNTISTTAYGENSIYVYNTSGSSITTLSGFSPSFDGIDAVYFSRGNEVLRKELGGVESSVTSIPGLGLYDGAYGFDLSPDGTALAYWIFSQTTPSKINYYNIGGAHVPLATNYGEPIWFDNSSVIAYEAQLEDFGIPYAKPLALVRISKIDGSVTILDDRDNIYRYDVD